MRPNHCQETIDLIDDCLREVSHERHVQILRDVGAVAVLNASDKTKCFDYDDATETIAICEAWVMGAPVD